MTINCEKIPFVQGQQVIDRNDPGNIAEYTGKFRAVGSRLMVELRFPNGNLKLRPLSEITAIQQGKTNSLLEQMQQELFGSLVDLRQLITFEKLKGSLHDVIYSMETAQIDFYPYQYKPVIKFINSPSERLLLADEVGLGKTIEAALVWMEMQARYQAKRLLVICPKILAEKWRDELQQKFLIDAKIVDFVDLQSEIRNLKRYGESYSFALIGTYSGLRPPKDAREEVRIRPEDSKAHSPKAALLQELRFWPEEYQALDLVIFDEAHYMRNQATTTFLLGESLSTAEAARAVLCVSATPVNNSNIDLHSLLRLIDEDFFATQVSFEGLIQSNRPAVEAANALAKHPVDQKALSHALERMSVIPHISNSPYFHDLLKRLDALAQKKFSEPALLAKCQDIAEKMNVLGSYINRTRRIQVQENRPIRVPKVVSVVYTKGEMDLYQAILGAVREHCLKNNSEFHVFQIMTWQLMAASCLPAFVEKIKAGRGDDSNNILAEAFGNNDSDEVNKSDIRQEIASWSDLFEYDFESNDSKLKQLYTLLQSEPAEKIIIFSYYRATLSYLHRKLGEIGESATVIHGGISVESRWAEIESFRSPTGPRVLLASEVGSEGIDLQFCHILINYDLPWNPMRVEQRIGRIDRIGQKEKRLSIVNFKITGTIEERIYVRLHEKLEKFSNSLGDLDEILGTEIRKLTIDLLSKNLSPEEEERRISQTQQAIERKQLDMQHLEESGEGLIALSDYVQKKIEEDRGRGRYIQPSELEAYVSFFFERFYKGTVINYNTPAQGCMQISLSDEARDSLFNFMRDDRTVIATHLRKKIFTITFDHQIFQVVSRSKKVVFINHMSPFIKWITKLNKDNELSLYKIAAISSTTSLLEIGTYIFRIDKWSLSGITKREKLAYGFISIENGKCISSYDAEVAFQDIFKNGSQWIYRTYDKSVISDRYNSLEEYMYAQFHDEASDFELENSNLIEIKRDRVSTIFNRKIFQDKQRLATLIENARSDQVINMTHARIKKNEDIMQLRLEKLQIHEEVEPEANAIALGIVKVER